MTTQFVRGEPHERGPIVVEHHHRRGTTWTEAFFAAGGLALAIIGLSGAAPRWLDTIADIAIGLAFLFERWSVTARQHEGAFTGLQRDRGLTAEAVAGWTGVVLGILSLVRVAPSILAPIAVLVFGAGLAIGTGLGTRSGRILIGCAAIVLGILAIIGIDPHTLTLIGLIGVSAALLLSGPLFAWRRHPIEPHAAHPAV
jgi:hypothetical protein